MPGIEIRVRYTAAPSDDRRVQQRHLQAGEAALLLNRPWGTDALPVSFAMTMDLVDVQGQARETCDDVAIARIPAS
jgi:hypothetical protein